MASTNPSTTPAGTRMSVRTLRRDIGQTRMDGTNEKAVRRRRILTADFADFTDGWGRWKMHEDEETTDYGSGGTRAARSGILGVLGTEVRAPGRTAGEVNQIKSPKSMKSKLILNLY